MERGDRLTISKSGHVAV